jgi:sec-independent protein translocase protein TatC
VVKLPKFRRPQRDPEGRMSLADHLGELRHRLMVSILAVVIAATMVFVFAPSIIHWLIQFYNDSAPKGTPQKFIFTGPLDAFATRLKIATYGGIVLAMPVWLWELWRFITPGLNPKEKKYAVPFILSSIALFALGGVVALLTLQPALKFLLGIGGADLQPLLTADKYISLVALMILAFGLAFEFPIILMFLLIARVISTQQLRKWRRISIVIIVAFAAVITPSQDPYSLFAMAIPMYIFYEMCIIIGRIMKR